jgi:flagellar motor switch protein FliM
LSPKGRAGASKDEPPAPKKRASASKAQSPPAKGRAAAQAEEQIQAPPGSQASIRKLDFSQPTKFTTEIRRRIAGAVEQLCEALAGRLAGELAVDVELSVAEVDQQTWAAAKARLPADAVAVAVEARAIERHMLLSVEQPLLLQALECLLGGQAANAPPERHLTDIDWVLAKGLFEGIVAELSSVWGELGGPELSCGEVDLEADAGVFAPAGEPTFSVTIATRIDGQSSALSLLIPWAAVEPVAESIRGGACPPLVGDVRDPHALRRGLAAAQILLRAEVGSVQMPIERMLELAVVIRDARGRAARSSSIPPARTRLGPTHTRSWAAPSWSGRVRTLTMRARARMARRSCAASSCACGPSWDAPTYR